MVRGLESVQGGIMYACSVLKAREGVCFWLLPTEAMRTLSLMQHNYYYVSEQTDLSDSKSSYLGS